MDNESRIRVRKYFGIDEEVIDDDLQNMLDEAVHDYKSEEAVEINNRGPYAQLEYLGA
jgi:hypothetical protein